MTPQERRRNRRVPYPREVRGYSYGERLEGSRLGDISEVGAFVETRSQLPVESSVLLGFEAGGRRIRVDAEVVHQHPERGLGVRFVGLRPGQRDRIARAVGEARRALGVS